MRLLRFIALFLLDLIVFIALSSFFERAAIAFHWVYPFTFIAWVGGAVFASAYLSVWRPKLTRKQ